MATATRSSRGLLKILALAGGAVLLSILALDRSPADSAFPGENGKLALQSDRDGNPEIYTMNPDGSDQTRLTDDPAFDLEPAWSPDGARIAFRSDQNIYVMNGDGTGRMQLTDTGVDFQPVWSPDSARIAFASARDGNEEIYVMNADGTNETWLTHHVAWDDNPAWSPDGTKIAFESNRDGNDEIYVMSSDGSGQTNLTSNSAEDAEPAWSPDGTKIAFASTRGGHWDIHVMNADGTGVTNVSNHPQDTFAPAWSPDGTKIAFEAVACCWSRDVFVMNADGTGQTNLTNNPAAEREPDWQPLRTPTPPPLERTAPYDFVSEGLVNCERVDTNGTGDARVRSDATTGRLNIDIRARSLSGRADARSAVGVRYSAPASGRIAIEAEVDVRGWDWLQAIGVPKLGATGMASVESGVAIYVSRLRTVQDFESNTNFASRLLTPLPGGKPVDAVFYLPKETYRGRIEIDVASGDELLICAGVKSKVVAAGLVPWTTFAKAQYDFNQTKLNWIRVSYQ